MDEIFCIDDFFSDSDMNQIQQSISLKEPGRDYLVPHGPFAGKLIANYVKIIDDTQVISDLTKKISTVMSHKFNIISADRVKLFFPWDIHSDYFQRDCTKEHKPYYNFLIPLDNVESRTVVFDQYSVNDDDFAFFVYKQQHQPLTNPISAQFWGENLSFCWPQDREYLSLRKHLPLQKRGQLQAFPSKYFHSSDNFHTKFSSPKSFVQLRTEYIHNA